MRGNLRSMVALVRTPAPLGVFLNNHQPELAFHCTGKIRLRAPVDGAARGVPTDRDALWEIADIAATNGTGAGLIDSAIRVSAGGFAAIRLSIASVSFDGLRIDGVKNTPRSFIFRARSWLGRSPAVLAEGLADVVWPSAEAGAAVGGGGAADPPRLGGATDHTEAAGWSRVMPDRLNRCSSVGAVEMCHALSQQAKCHALPRRRIIGHSASLESPRGGNIDVEVTRSTSLSCSLVSVRRSSYRKMKPSARGR